MLFFYYFIVWADNADFCAKQYAGTGALKTDFTRSNIVGICITLHSVYKMDIYVCYAYLSISFKFSEIYPLHSAHVVAK